MRKLKMSVKTVVASTLVVTSTAAMAYAVPKIIDIKSSDIGNKLVLDVQKVDNDTVKVSIDNIKDIPKSLQFSIKLDGDVVLKDGEASIRDLVLPEVENRLKNSEYIDTTNSILTDYTYNEDSNTIDVLITSENSLPKTEEKIEIFELDIASLKGEEKASGTTYKVVPNNEDDYKYLTTTNKEYNNLGVFYDDKTISMNSAPTIKSSKDYISLVEDEELEINIENLGLTLEDGDRDEVNLEVRDLSQSNKPLITKFSKATPGVYNLECVAIDSYGEKSEALILPVNVDYDKITAMPTITKDNKPLEKEINLNAGDVYKPLENVKAVDAKGREVEVKVESDKELNFDPDNDTTYTLTYTAKDMYNNEAKEIVVINVKANKAPIIVGVKDHEIKVGDSFDPREGVIVVDEDKDIKLLVESNVNTNIAGEYKVSYTATDSKGKTTRAQSKVVVIGKEEAINNAPVIYANDKTIKQGTEFNPLDGVSATDKEDGNLTSKIIVEENNVNTNKVGSYKVIYSVSDSQGLEGKKTIKVDVIGDDISDVTLAENIKINNKFDKIYTKASKEITATVNKEADNKDVAWSISDNEIATLEVQGNTARIIGNKEGKIIITASTVDGSNKSDSFEIEIVDFENDSKIPKELKDLINLKVLNPVTGEGSKDLPVELEVKDVEVEDFREFTNDIKRLSPVILSSYEENNYTVYKIKLSTKARLFKKSTDYYIDIKIDNSLDNAVEYKNILNKISNNAPEIITDGLKTTVKAGEKFDPLNGVIAVDKEDGNLTSKIKVIGKVDTSKVGDYEITYEVEDKDGEKTSKTVNIKVVENESPVLPEEPEKPEVPDKPSEPNTSVDSGNKEEAEGSEDEVKDTDTKVESEKGNSKEDTSEVSKEDSVVKDEETEKEDKRGLIYIGIGAVAVGSVAFLFQKND